MIKYIVKYFSIVLVIVLCFVSVSYQAINSEQIHAVQEGGFLKLTCLEKKINIVWAWYGVPGTKCKSLSAHEVVQKRCHGFKVCEIGATNQNFGDPCPGTIKSLSILYKCESEESNPITIGDSYSGQMETVVEGEILKLNCLNIYKIQIIWATYGVSGCGKTVTGIMQGKCDGMNSCNVQASNSHFQDPCPGRKKVLSVIYRCYLKSPPNYLEDAYPGTFRKVEEHKVLDIRCGSSIITVDWAWYGIPDTSCRAIPTLEVIKQRCEGTSNCKIQASNLNFGDPCPGTVKSLSILYRCLTKEDYNCL